MKNTIARFSLACIIGFSSIVSIKAQDVIYFKNDTKKVGKINEISKDKIEFQETPDSKIEKLNKAELILVLFEDGAFLTFPTEFKGITGPPETRHAEDWLLTKDLRIVPCVVNNGDGNPITVSTMGDTAKKDYSIPKDVLLGILFSNGNKQLLGTKPPVIAEVLRRRQIINPTIFLDQYEVKPVANKKKELGPELDLDQASHEQFKQKSLQKTEDLGKYLNLIANKSTESAVANKAVDQAVGLFLSEESTVETTKPNGDKDQQPVRGYLNKLKLLKYSKVLIEWSDISYVSNLRKGPDGNYYGVISLQQKFSGFIDNKLVYSDVTRKNVEVVLKTYKKEVDGESVELWDVFLNNVGISASRN